jgi:NADH-quinone oxidoreductase subunit N
MVSLPLVILTAFNTKDHRSSEAGMKYVVYSALSSGLLLYGLSMVYGMAGSTYLDIISQRLTLSWLSILSSVFILSGVGFKVAAVPFHIWTLDVYEGAPIPVTAFLSVASKAAGLALLYKIVIQPFGEVIFSWQLLVAILATLTMTFGNLAALHQNNMKRFLACSSIAQAGYILVGMVNPEPFGRAAVIYYLLVYIISNIAAFGAVIAIANATGREDMRDYVGLSISNPKLALVFMLAMFSLAGIPPLAGFIGKFYLFAAAAKLGMYWLVLVGTINATISLYYYLMVVKWAYLVKPDAHASPLQVFNIPFVHRFVLFVVTVGMVLVGIVPHFIRWAQVVAGSAL